MPDSKVILFASFGNSAEAHIVRSLLEANGINSIVEEDRILNLLPVFTSNTQRVKLKILEKDLRAALEIYDPTI